MNRILILICFNILIFNGMADILNAKDKIKSKNNNLEKSKKLNFVNVNKKLFDLYYHSQAAQAHLEAISGDQPNLFFEEKYGKLEKMKVGKYYSNTILPRGINVFLINLDTGDIFKVKTGNRVLIENTLSAHAGSEIIDNNNYLENTSSNILGIVADKIDTYKKLKLKRIKNKNKINNINIKVNNNREELINNEHVLYYYFEEDLFKNPPTIYKIRGIKDLLLIIYKGKYSEIVIPYYNEEFHVLSKFASELRYALKINNKYYISTYEYKPETCLDLNSYYEIIISTK